jgi:hypothetical protein
MSPLPKLLLPLSLLILTSCASNKALVADSAAKYTYNEWAYEEACTRPTTAPGYCLRCYEALKKFKALTEICNTTQKIGELPPEAIKALKEAQAGLDNACR